MPLNADTTIDIKACGLMPPELAPFDPDPLFYRMVQLISFRPVHDREDLLQDIGGSDRTWHRVHAADLCAANLLEREQGPIHHVAPSANNATSRWCLVSKPPPPVRRDISSRSGVTRSVRSARN